MLEGSVSHDLLARSQNNIWKLEICILLFIGISSKRYLQPQVTGHRGFMVSKKIAYWRLACGVVH